MVMNEVPTTEVHGTLCCKRIYLNKRAVCPSSICAMSLSLHLKSCSFTSLGKCFLETCTKVRVVSSEDIELLSLRSKLAPADIYEICSHHEKVYLHKYSALQRRCCNAFAQHENSRKMALRDITTELRANALMGVSLVPGDKLCALCRTHLQKVLALQVSEEVHLLGM